MSKIRYISRYLIQVVIILFITVMSVGCRKDNSDELELKEVPVQEERADQEEKSYEDSGEDSQDSENEKAESEEGLRELYVHVCGNVKHPGVYELEAGSRVYEAIEAAGGMTDTAAFSYLNQAELLKDEQQLYVPSQEEIDSGKFASQITVGQGEKDVRDVETEDSGKVNLNTATKEELMTLNGIGEVRAQAILQYREEHGEFRSVEELMEVEGIKKGTFQKLKDQIKI